jgi:hypothetical protein
MLQRQHINPAARGYHAAYHEGEVNHCPGCHRTHWIIGRVSAECAFCATALPLLATMTQGHDRPIVIRRGHNHTELLAA